MLQIIGRERDSSPYASAIGKIEVGLRQYASHSRDLILFAHRPFSIETDHLVIVTSQGAGFIAFSRQPGNLRGGAEGPWTLSQLAQRDIQVENPIPSLEQGRLQLLSTIRNSVARSNEETRQTSIEKFSTFTKGIAIIDEAQSVRLNEKLDLHYEVITLEQAVARTAFHVPNLLHLINSGVVCFSREGLEEIQRELSRLVMSSTREEPVAIARTPEPDSQDSSKGKRTWLWLLAAAAILSLLIYLLTSTGGSEPTGTRPDDSTSHVIQRPVPNSSVVIKVPQSTQLFISSQVFDTRSALDQAILNGQGFRSLPSTEHRVTMDSIRFAEGVYGYFKVENEWRKGKLLQTFKSTDTFIIDNFLPPLKN